MILLAISFYSLIFYHFYFVIHSKIIKYLTFNIIFAKVKNARFKIKKKVLNRIISYTILIFL